MRTPNPTTTVWWHFTRDAVVAGLVAGAVLVSFVAAADPYGLRAAPGHPPGPIVDSNQRLSYPAIARGGAFDAAVFGTSTARLLDPAALDAAFGARFANLAVNAATPDEQLRLAALFLARRPVKAVLFGLDAPWCVAHPAARTEHAFPDWLYAPGAPLGVLRQVNLRGLTAAANAVRVRFGFGSPRIRADGYGVFTPPEETYDLGRARAHIAAGTGDPEAPADPPDAPFPALDRLDAALAALPPETRKIVAFMPVHVRAQGRPGTAAGLREAACKARVAAIGADRNTLVVDFRRPSSVTTQDANYWDALHYRLPVAGRIVAGLEGAAETGADAPDGFYRVLAR
ncbi:hypothetical protein [Methylobacterium sp. J-076]|uniref:hypothetical protein n=1 Tax=Methylobacterium sp. J-076 TaxID=2836655 RepID=UPI001FBABD89|nr:hypothetical protein [Methylobacterium sp. J-076]MCJ2013320.1 hypothetical protein [Methylobacterium sp. J-076]